MSVRLPYSFLLKKDLCVCTCACVHAHPVCAGTRWLELSQGWLLSWSSTEGGGGTGVGVDQELSRGSQLKVCTSRAGPGSLEMVQRQAWVRGHATIFVSKIYSNFSLCAHNFFLIRTKEPSARCWLMAKFIVPSAASACQVC